MQENLKMPTALLSRFDLVFILVDRAELDHDQRLSEHVIRSHLGAQAFNMYKQSKGIIFLMLAVLLYIVAHENMFD